MKRIFVFLLLGPVLGVLVLTVATGEYVELYGIPIAFFFSLIVCVITGPVDGVLTYVPVWLRVPLISIVGAAVATVLCLNLLIQLGNRMVLPPLHELIPIAVIGAFNTALCSLLSHNYCRSHLQ